MEYEGSPTSSKTFAIRPYLVPVESTFYLHKLFIQAPL
jgi:hypothetical protein